MTSFEVETNGATTIQLWQVLNVNFNTGKLKL